MARPSSFSPEVADEICERLAEGESLRTICAGEGMPYRGTVFRWLASDEKFRLQYAHARDAQADTLADEIVDIADDGTRDTYLDADGNEKTNQDVIARSRLRVDARKWVASKLKPKVYGDRTTTAITGADGGPVQVAATININPVRARD